MSVMLLLPLAVGTMTLTGCVADPPPQIVGAVAGDHSATVSWLAPLASPGGVVAYVVTPYINAVAQTPTRFDSTATTETVTGLTNGAKYTFTVTAMDALGNDSASSGQTSAVAPPGVIAVTTQFEHTCAVTGQGTVYCWGNNNSGQLGDSTMNNSSTPVQVVGMNGATQVAAGDFHTCALVPPGTVFCWGANGSGQLGNGTTNNVSVPTLTSGINTATAIATGDTHSCALLAGGTIKCWGDNSTGQLGNGTTTNSTTPVTVSGVSTATAIAAGDGSTCALLADATVVCWGYNSSGQLGNGTTIDTTTPVPLAGFPTASAIASGDSHECALLLSGHVSCWGANGSGDLGFDTSPYGYSDVAGDWVALTKTPTAITAGFDHTCALVDNHTVWCWGDNGYGELGNGNFFGATSPVEVLGIGGATTLAAGLGNTCAVVTLGVKCWGLNSYGELGDGTTTITSTPVAVVWP